MSEFFGSVRGALSVYCDNNDGALTDARFILCRHGESADLAVAAFFREHCDARHTVVPLFAHGSAPRPELCSRASLREALKTAVITPESATEQQWKSACEAHGVPWNAHKAAPGWKAPANST